MHQRRPSTWPFSPPLCRLGIPHLLGFESSKIGRACPGYLSDVVQACPFGIFIDAFFALSIWKKITKRVENGENRVAFLCQFGKITASR
jgi:hypothetical protein